MPTETRYCKPGATVETLDPKTGQKRLLMTITENAPLWIPGEDIQYVVTPDGLPPKTPPAPPDIVVGDSPFPKIAPGQSIEAALKVGSGALQRGAAYTVTSTVNVYRDGVTLGACGDPALPKPLLQITTNQRCISVEGRKDFTLDGVELRTTYPTHTDAGLWLLDAPGALVLRSTISRFRLGFASQANSLGVGGSVLVEDSWIHDNSRQGDNHGAGYYANKVAVTLRRSMFDTNGWRPGSITRDDKSHNAYTQGQCTPALAEDCLFNDGSSHGIQMRSGGTLRRCAFLNNPIAISFGRVNGGPCFAGGVKGSIEDVWVIGCPQIADDHRPGWALELGNIADVTVNGFYADGDDLGTAAAVIVGACKALDNPKDDVGIRSLAMANVYAPKWRRGVRDVQLGQVSALGVSAKPPARYSDLRLAIGTSGGFVVNARKNPSTAAANFIAACKAAWGMN